MKVLSAKVNQSTYRRFEHKRTEEKLTKSEAIREGITQFLQSTQNLDLQPNLKFDGPFILQESLRILKKTKTMLEDAYLMGQDKTKIINFLDREIKSFQKKFEQEQRV